jgi:hypothetical protein
LSYFADPQTCWKDWDYIQGDRFNNMSIAIMRYRYLFHLNFLSNHTMEIALHDKDSDMFTRWQGFNQSFSFEDYQDAYDIHRSLLQNEIVIESDYPEYEDNVIATRAIGQRLEKEGFIPHYYYSGNKGVHIHIFMDMSALTNVSSDLQKQILEKYKLKKNFLNDFITYLRSLLISFFRTDAYKFDKALAKGRHLIRSEMSRNKQGYKTFLGYSYKDVSIIPYVCNEENRIYPKIGEIRLSVPHNLELFVLDFLKDAAQNERKGNHNLLDFVPKTDMRNCVKTLQSHEFFDLKDGENRALFILSNELKSLAGEINVYDELLAWNFFLHRPFSDYTLQQYSKSKRYSLTCSYIHEFLKDIGLTHNCPNT